MHRDELRGQAHDAERTCDGQGTDEPRQRGRDHASEHEEQHHADQRDGGDLGAFLVLADGSGQLAGQRLQAGLLDLDAVDVEGFFDGRSVFAEVLVVVVQDHIVVVALELDRHERAFFVVVGHVLEHFGALEVADGAKNLVGVVLFDLGEVVDDLLLERRIFDCLTLGRGVDRDDVSGRIAAVGIVGDQ